MNLGAREMREDDGERQAQATRTLGGRSKPFTIAPTSTTLVTTGVVVLLCPNCQQLRPVEWRNCPDGTLRNQPRCGPCRHVKNPSKDTAPGEPEAAESRWQANDQCRLPGITSSR